MSDYTRTPFLSLYKPTPDADNDAWGGHLNANADVLDSTLNGLVVGAGGPWLQTAGGTMTGPLTLGPSLIWSSTTATGFGTGIGQIPVFVNYQNSGNPGLLFPPRLVIDRSGPSSDVDFATVQINRTVTHSAGNSGAVTSALRVISSVNASSTNQEWAIVGQASSASTVGAIAVGGDFQGIRQPGSNATIWGGIFDVIDNDAQNSSVRQHAVLGCEIDIEAGGADDAPNAACFGGVGMRKGIQMVLVRRSTASDLEATTGLWFTTVEPTHAKWSSAIGFAVGVQTYQALDVRGAVAPTGYTDPVAAVRMSAGQSIDFNGGAALNSNGGNYLQYTSTGTARLRYMVGAFEAASINNVGNTTSNGFTCVGAIASGPTDLTKHIALFGALYGFNVTSGMINYQSGGGHSFYSSTSLEALINATGVTSAGLMQVGGISGPTWTTGAGVPGTTQPVGSLYSRVGGAVGATLYISRGAGTWAAVAGV